MRTRYIYDETTGDTIYPEDVGREREGPCRCSRDEPCECPRVCDECGHLSADVGADGICERCLLDSEDEPEEVLP